MKENRNDYSSPMAEELEIQAPLNILDATSESKAVVEGVASDYEDGDLTF